MSTNPRTRPSPRLVLYGIVFRVLCSVALHAGDRASICEPVHAAHQPDPCHSPPRKGRSPLPLNLDPGQ